MAKNVRKVRRSARSSAADGDRVVGSSPASPPTRPDASVTARSVPGKNGGTLLPHAPGSNGGVHRGPDRFPRESTVRAIIFKALVKEGLTLADLRQARQTKGGRRRHRALIPHAALEYAAEGYRNIMADAALGEPRAYGPFVHVMDHIHRVMQNGKADGGGGAGPIPGRFVRPGELPPAPTSAPAPEPGSLIIDGQEYVDPRV